MERVETGQPSITVPAQGQRLSVIIDTDIGGEPDDAMSLVIAARELPELALVITSDEMSGQRARFARYLLDCLHRPDVQVVSGAQLSPTPNFFAHGLTPAQVGRQPDDVGRAVGDVFDRACGQVRWIGFGPLSNLAALLAQDPGLARRLVVTQLGGLAGESGPALPQRNFRLDPGSARVVLAAARDLRLVNFDGAFGRDAEVTATSPAYRQLTEADGPSWARLLGAHCDQFFARYHPAIVPASPLALSAALRLPFTRFRRARVSVDEAGRLVDWPGQDPPSVDPPSVDWVGADRLSVARPGADRAERGILVSGGADHLAFDLWLRARLRPVVWPNARGWPNRVSLRRRSTTTVA